MSTVTRNQTSTRSTSELVEVIHKWTVDHFNYKRKAISSDKFSSSNRNDDKKWELVLYPQGTSEEDRDYLSLYLTLIDDRKDMDLVVYFDFILTDEKTQKDLKQTRIATRTFSTGSSGNNNSWGYPRLIRRETVRDELGLENGNLRITCNVRYTNEISRPCELVLPPVPCTMSRDIGALLGDETFADVTVTIIFEGSPKNFRVHKTILVSRSAYFRAMFSTNFVEGLDNVVKIKDVSHVVFEKILVFMYTGTMDCNSINPKDLLVSADRFELLGLKRLVENYLVSNITAQNSLDMLLFGTKYVAKDLETSAMDFAARNLKEVQKTEDWIKFTQENPELMDTIIAMALDENMIGANASRPAPAPVSMIGSIFGPFVKHFKAD